MSTELPLDRYAIGTDYGSQDGFAAIAIVDTVTGEASVHVFPEAAGHCERCGGPAKTVIHGPSAFHDAAGHDFRPCDGNEDCGHKIRSESNGE